MSDTLGIGLVLAWLANMRLTSAWRRVVALVCVLGVLDSTIAAWVGSDTFHKYTVYDGHVMESLQHGLRSWLLACDRGIVSGMLVFLCCVEFCTRVICSVLVPLERSIASRWAWTRDRTRWVGSVRSAASCVAVAGSEFFPSYRLWCFPQVQLARTACFPPHTT